MSIPKPSAPIPGVIKWFFGPLMLLFGSLTSAVALGWIDVVPARLHTPMWLVGATGLAFLSLGLVVMLDGVTMLEKVRGWLGLMFFLSFASIFNWVAFGPGERHFTVRTGFGSGAAHMSTSSPGDELTGRIMFGLFAILLDLLLLSPWLLKAWRWWQGNGRGPR